MNSEPILDVLQPHFEASPIALSLAEAGGDQEMLLVNNGFCALTGYSPAEVIGRNCRFLQGSEENAEARERIHRFFQDRERATVRTPILNFDKGGRPFVNLLYMSKLRTLAGDVRYIIASQFDISRTRPDLLRDYDHQLAGALAGLSPPMSEAGVMLEGALTAISNTAAAIAQAKVTLAEIDNGDIL